MDFENGLLPPESLTLGQNQSLSLLILQKIEFDEFVPIVVFNGNSGSPYDSHKS